MWRTVELCIYCISRFFLKISISLKIIISNYKKNCAKFSFTNSIVLSFTQNKIGRDVCTNHIHFFTVFQNIKPRNTPQFFNMTGNIKLYGCFSLFLFQQKIKVGLTQASQLPKKNESFKSAKVFPINQGCFTLPTEIQISRNYLQFYGRTTDVAWYWRGKKYAD